MTRHMDDAATEKLVEKMTQPERRKSPRERLDEEKLSNPLAGEGWLEELLTPDKLLSGGALKTVNSRPHNGVGEFGWLTPLGAFEVGPFDVPLAAMVAAAVRNFEVPQLVTVQGNPVLGDTFHQGLAQCRRAGEVWGYVRALSRSVEDNVLGSFELRQGQMWAKYIDLKLAALRETASGLRKIQALVNWSNHRTIEGKHQAMFDLATQHDKTATSQVLFSWESRFDILAWATVPKCQEILAEVAKEVTMR